MRSYHINTDRLVNQLLPHYLGGRKLVLLLQALLTPLQTLAIKWEQWANNKRMEAAMTSQIILFENFLNKRFSKYLQNPSDRILISDGELPGVPLYWEELNSNISYLTLYSASEQSSNNPTMYWRDEKLVSSDVSFIVVCPSVNTQIISEKELSAMISYYVNRYKVAGKKYTIIYN